MLFLILTFKIQSLKFEAATAGEATRAIEKGVHTHAHSLHTQDKCENTSKSMTTHTQQ
jgi:hypothetical protein